MLVCALVLTDMCNTLFDLIKEAVDCGHRGNRTVSTVVGQIRCFEIGRFAKFIFVCPMAFLAKGIGRESVLLEQAGNLEALPEGREMLNLLPTEGTNSFWSQKKTGNFKKICNQRKQALAGKGNGFIS